MNILHFSWEALGGTGVSALRAGSEAGAEKKDKRAGPVRSSLGDLTHLQPGSEMKNVFSYRLDDRWPSLWSRDHNGQ